MRCERATLELGGIKKSKRPPVSPISRKRTNMHARTHAACMYVFGCVYISTHVHVFISVSTYAYIHIREYVRVCYMRIHTYVCIYVCVCVCLCSCRQQALINAAGKARELGLEGGRFPPGPPERALTEGKAIWLFL